MCITMSRGGVPRYNPSVIDALRGWIRRTPWLALYLVALIAAALTPLRFSTVPQPVSLSPVPHDVLFNVLGFIPLGWALRRAPSWVVLLSGLGLSGGFELLQLYQIRTPYIWDLGANGIGTLLGARLLIIDGTWSFDRTTAYFFATYAIDSFTTLTSNRLRG